MEEPITESTASVSRVFGRVFKAIAALLVFLVVFDVIGVVACFVLDVAPLRYGSSLLLYAVWFVLGVFCGVLYLMLGTGLLSNPKDDAAEQREVGGRTGLFVIGLTTMVLLLLSLWFYWIYWRYNPSGDDVFVPDSMGPTLTFFISMLAGMVVIRQAAKPSPRPKA